MKEATFDPAKKLKLYFRCNRNGSKDFVFVYADGSAYSLIYEDVELNIYRNQGDKKKTVQLNVSYANNRVTTSITESLSNINEGEYYWELYRPNLGKTWLTGKAIFHNGEFDGVESDSETRTVNENGEDVLITISQAGITQAELDAALALKADLNTRVISTTTTATLTPDIDLYDMFILTAQSEALVIANPTGTPSNGNGFMVDIDDDGTARAMSFGASYSGIFVALPSTTVLGKRMKLVFQYNGLTLLWELLNVINEL